MAEKLKVLQAISPLKRDDLVVGQYQRSGKHPGYLEDSTIENKESNTETFAAAVLSVDNPRWDGVPFVLKAGKALTDRKAEVRIQFHRVPGAVSALRDCAANELVVRLQPDETIYWKVINKVPGLKFQVRQRERSIMAEHHPPTISSSPRTILPSPPLLLLLFCACSGPRRRLSGVGPEAREQRPSVCKLVVASVFCADHGPPPDRRSQPYLGPHGRTGPKPLRRPGSQRLAAALRDRSPSPAATAAADPRADGRRAASEHRG